MVNSGAPSAINSTVTICTAPPKINALNNCASNHVKPRCMANEPNRIPQGKTAKLRGNISNEPLITADSKAF